MKTFFLKFFIFVFSITVIFACSEDEQNQNITNPPTTISLEGTWKADEIQIISAPTVNPGIWKPALVMWGKVSVSTIGNLELTFQSNGNWSAVGYLTNTAIRAMVKDNQPGSNYSANGRYTKSDSTLTINLDNYSGRGPTTGQTTCTYSISGDKMTLTVNLNNNEKWQITYNKQ